MFGCAVLAGSEFVTFTSIFVYLSKTTFDMIFDFEYFFFLRQVDYSAIEIRRYLAMSFLARGLRKNSKRMTAKEVFP